MAETRIKPRFLNLPPGSRVQENRVKSEGLSTLGSSSESRIKPGFFLYLTLSLSQALGQLWVGPLSRLAATALPKGEPSLASPFGGGAPAGGGEGSGKPPSWCATVREKRFAVSLAFFPRCAPLRARSKLFCKKASPKNFTFASLGHPLASPNSRTPPRSSPRLPPRSGPGCAASVSAPPLSCRWPPRGSAPRPRGWPKAPAPRLPGPGPR